MEDGPPPGDIELLDEWDDDLPTSRRRTRTWLLGPLALVAVVAIVVAVVLGGTKQAALTVTSSPPATPSATSGATVSDPAPTSWATVDATLPTGGITYTRVDASGATILAGPGEAWTPDPIPSDAEAEPLVVTLLDKQPRTSPGVVAYNVRVCVSGSSAALNGGRVKVVRRGWMLGGIAEPFTPMTAGGITPAFPEESTLRAGQCVSGYVSFQVPDSANYIAIYFADDRFSWGWRVS